MQHRRGINVILPCALTLALMACGSDSGGPGVTPDDECPNDPNKTEPGICGCGVSDTDADDDGVAGCEDNCPSAANSAQTDTDDDGVGDACDPCVGPNTDTDGDETPDCTDECPNDAGKVKTGVCGCGVPDKGDIDSDSIFDCVDDCPADPKNDEDKDGVCGDIDICPEDADPDQKDTDKDGMGDVCDPCPEDPKNDEDMDDVCGDVDNCPVDPNPEQNDEDEDGVGDVCDPDHVECLGEPGECDDDIECTMDSCVEGDCVYEPKDSRCVDGNPCTDDVCDPLAGCVHENNTADCDDDNPCTLQDTCKDGVCTGYQNQCPCLKDEDCEDLDDGDLCNGTLICESSYCQVDLNSVVTCEPTDNPCRVTQCDPPTGDCLDNPKPEGTPCSDADVCTSVDECAEGECVGASPVDCDDQNPCTDDFCDPVAGCQHEDNDDSCDDMDACTDGDICIAGMCVGGSPLDCNDDNPCTTDGCHAVTGCINLSNEGSCEDGDACTVGDKCSDGQCQPGSSVNCVDGNPCTSDTCDSAQGCVFTPANEGVGCDDGNECTVDDACTLGKCKGTGIDCDDGNPCTDDKCDDPAVGCYYEHNTNPCEDGDLCTTEDTCSAGSCQAGSSVVCDDGNPCSDDECDGATGSCMYPFNTAPCDDGDSCTEGDMCLAGSCQSGPVMDCHDGNACTVDSCVDGQCDHQPRDSQVFAGVARSMLARDDGSFIVVGETDVVEGQDRDYWARRFLADSTVAWKVEFGGDVDQYAVDVAAGPSGSFVVLGTNDPYGASDAWLGARKADGDPLWEETYGGDSVDVAHALVSVPDGWVIAGQTWSYGNGKNDGWFLRTTLTGKKTWDKVYGIKDKDIALDIVRMDTEVETFAFAGARKNPHYDGWLGKLDAGGVLVWDEIYVVGDQNDYFYSIDTMPMGGFVTAGFAYINPSYDAWLVQTDAEGKITDEDFFGGDGFDWFRTVATHPDGGFVAGGSRDGVSSGTPGPSWVIRTDKDGNQKWEWTDGASGWAFKVLPIEEDGVVATGYKDGSGFFVFLDKDGKACGTNP